MTIIQRAEAYVKSGFHVFPCCWPDFTGHCACGRNHADRDAGKVPLTPKGLTDATQTSLGVKEFWTTWPKANIAIAIPRGYFVLDVDVSHNGYESIEKLQKDKDFELPRTLQITTGSGGAHLWYKTNEPIKNTTRLAGYDGLDIRGVGGYVIAPPSIHRNGKAYRKSEVWPGPITDGPPQLIELCLKKQPAVVMNGNNPELPISEGSRNDTLARDAGAMRRRGLSQDAILAALLVENQQRCNPPLTENEVAVIARSVSRYMPEIQPAPPQTQTRRIYGKDDLSFQEIQDFQEVKEIQ